MAKRAEKAAGDVYPSEAKPPKDVDPIEETGLRNTNTSPVDDEGKPVKTPTEGSIEAEAKAKALAEEKAKEAEAKLDEEAEAAKKNPDPSEPKEGCHVLVNSYSSYMMFQHDSDHPAGGFFIQPKGEFQKAKYDAWLKGCVEVGLVEIVSVLKD